MQQSENVASCQRVTSVPPSSVALHLLPILYTSHLYIYIVDSKMSPALGLKNAIQPLPGVHQNALKLSGIVCSNTFKYIQIICSMHNHLPILIGHEGHPGVGHIPWWRSAKSMGLIRIDSRNLDLHRYIPYQLGSRHINRLWFYFG